MARKSTTAKSTSPPSPLSAVLEKLVIPSIMAEQESGDDGSSIDWPDPESDDYNRQAGPAWAGEAQRRLPRWFIQETPAKSRLLATTQG